MSTVVIKSLNNPEIEIDSLAEGVIDSGGVLEEWSDAEKRFHFVVAGFLCGG